MVVLKCPRGLMIKDVPTTFQQKTIPNSIMIHVHTEQGKHHHYPKSCDVQIPLKDMRSQVAPDSEKKPELKAQSHKPSNS